MKPDKRIKKRVAIGAQLIVGEDDDLIRWKETIPYGDGQDILKSILRRHLKLKQPKSAPSEIDVLKEQFAEWAKQVNDDREKWKTEAERLRVEMDELRAGGFPINPPVNTDTPTGKQIDAATAKRRKETAVSQW